MTSSNWLQHLTDEERDLREQLMEENSSLYRRQEEVKVELLYLQSLADLRRARGEDARSQ